MVSRLWTRHIYTDCKKSLPGNGIRLQIISSASLEIVVVPTKRLIEQTGSAISNYYRPVRDYGVALWCSFKCQRTRKGHKRVSAVRSGGYRASLGGSWLEHGCSLPTRHRYFPFPFNLKRFWDWFNGWHSDSDWRAARQRELSSSSASNISSLRETNPTPCKDEKWPLCNKNWEYSRLCLPKNVWITHNILVYTS